MLKQTSLTHHLHRKNVSSQHDSMGLVSTDLLQSKRFSASAPPEKREEGRQPQEPSVSCVLIAWKPKGHHVAPVSRQEELLNLPATDIFPELQPHSSLLPVPKSFGFPKRVYGFCRLPSFPRRVLTLPRAWGCSYCTFHDFSKLPFQLCQPCVLLTYDLGLL